MDSVVKYQCKFERTLKYSSDEDISPLLPE